jgi:hypothetical protein
MLTLAILPWSRLLTLGVSVLFDLTQDRVEQVSFDFQSRGLGAREAEVVEYVAFRDVSGLGGHLVVL